MHANELTVHTQPQPCFDAHSLSDGLSALNQGKNKISFGKAKLGGDGMCEVAMALKKHPDVYWLGFFDCEATLYSLTQLLNALAANKSLVHLDLGRNRELGDAGVELLCNFLATNKSVKELYLWDMGITDAGAKLLVNLLRKNRVIENLDVNDNPEISKALKSEIATLIKEGPTRVPASPRAAPMRNLS